MTDQTDVNTFDVNEDEIMLAPGSYVIAEATQVTLGEMQDWLDDLGITKFSAREVGYLGGSHNSPGAACFGKNELPPKSKWKNMEPTILALETFRLQVGAPMGISSAYRNEAYNSCISGATNSEHKKFTAIDFSSPSMDARDLGKALRIFRDNGGFKGGIGIYNTFVHIDTRGYNAEWKGSTTPKSDFDYVFNS